MNFLKRTIRKIPLVGEVIYKNGNQFLEGRKWKKTKTQILENATKIFNQKDSLDVSLREGLPIFHNKNNSLINRGDPYEPEVQICLKTLINLDKLRNAESVFADIGANIGLHTLHIWKTFPSISIIAFDPSPFSYKYLELTLKYNEIKNIKLEKVALSQERGELEFYNWGEESSADSLKDTKRVKGVIPKIIKVPAITLDSVENLPKVGVIKMDTEGAELTILRGAIQTLKSSQPYILLEFHKTNRKAFNVKTTDIFEFLKNIEYSILTLNFELISMDRFDQLQDEFMEDYVLLPNLLIKSIAGI